MDAEGNERRRLEGYLPRDEFQAYLEIGLARVAFMQKDWATAETHYASVLDKFPNSKFAPEAIYYKGVSRYSSTHDSGELATTASVLNEKFAGNEWQLRSIPWLREKSESTSG
jgi:outer membrane protein assembly factor BamD (BamD/ComL family)